jgi:hypothetical protein
LLVIQLGVSFDDSLVTRCASRDIRSVWPDFCRRLRVPELGERVNAFLDDDPLSPSDEMALAHTSKYLHDRRESSIADIERFFPETGEHISHDLIVAFVPRGTRMIGARPGLQFFSLFPDAHPVETYLFLVHVYYHEISDLILSEPAKRFSLNQRCALDLRRWLRLLIRNEGIGNYAVLNDLLEFRRAHPTYTFKYFGYAPQIGSAPSLDAAIHILNEVFTGVTDENLSSFRENVTTILKNKRLPIINLVGIHMATAVVEAHGLGALRNVHGIDAESFFELYASSGEPRASTFDPAVVRDKPTAN